MLPLRQASLRQNILGNQTTTFDEGLNSLTDNINHRFNFLVDTRIDSSTTIRVEPNISYTESDLRNASDYINTFTDNRTVGTQNFKTTSSSPTITNNILIRKKFLRRGRTLSLNVNTNINDSDSKNYNDIQENITSTTDGNTQNITDQLNDQNSNSISNTSRLVYTEPLTKTLNLEMNYQNLYSFSNSDRYTYDFNPVTSQYDIVNLDYTNSYENTTVTNAIGNSCILI